LFRRDSGGQQESLVARVDSQVADLWGEGIEMLVGEQVFVILRSSILCKVMEMEDEGRAASGQFGYESGEKGILSQGRVVEMPAGWFLIQDLGRDLKKLLGESGAVQGFGFSTVLIVERGDDPYGKPAGVLR
jgi:hypothetical protein